MKFHRATPLLTNLDIPNHKCSRRSYQRPIGYMSIAAIHGYVLFLLDVVSIHIAHYCYNSWNILLTTGRSECQMEFAPRQVRENLSSLLLSHALPVNPSLQTQLPFMHLPLPLHWRFLCALSMASAASLNATPLGHVRIEQSPPPNPLLHAHIPSGVQMPFREHLFGHPKQKGSTNGMYETALMLEGGLKTNCRCENLDSLFFFIFRA